MRLKLSCLIISICLSSCATKIIISKKYIRSNERFYDGLTINQLKVESFDSLGAPSKYSIDSVFSFDDVWSLTEEETLAMLKGKARDEYVMFKKIKDSLGKKEFESHFPADTIDILNGPKIYLSAGLRFPNEWHIAGSEMDRIKYTNINRKEKKIIHFSKPDKHYRLIAWPEGHYGKSVKLNKLVFTPGKWYMISRDCHFALLSSGRCTYYFSFDKRGKINLFRSDWKNDGPF